jgi:uncharacterized lipoprotein YmbA
MSAEISAHMKAMNIKLVPVAIVGAAFIAALLAGCAATVPAPTLLTLPPAALAQPMSAATAPASSASMPLLAVRRVGIPEYMVARRVRFRAEASTLAEWPNTFWGERIEIGVSREFVAALRQQLPGWALCDTNCGDQVATLDLQVELSPLDYVRSAQKLEARAHITVIATGVVPKVLQTQDLGYEIASNADTPQGQAQAMAALIAQVAAAAAPLVRAAQTMH